MANNVAEWREPNGTYVEIAGWVCKCGETTVRVEVVRRDQLEIVRDKPQYGINNPVLWCYVCRSHTMYEIPAAELEKVAPVVNRTQ